MMSPDLDDLEEKLDAAEKARKSSTKNRVEKALDEKQDGSRQGAQAGIEFVAAIMISTGIGIGLDKWLETSPLFLLVFFFLGLGTGFYNIYKIMGNMGTGVGLSQTNKK